MLESITMALYSLLLGCTLLLGSPYWLWRAARGGAGWRSSLLARLARVPQELRDAVAERQVVWVHAVSVGEVLAATRLVSELERALGDGWRIVLSTTTATGQALARQRFAANSHFESSGNTPGANRVFYYPLDFAWCVRAYLRALNPKMLVLMESELWPRMLVECARAGIPVAVVNARVSDRSYARGMSVHALWSRLLRQVTLFLAQSAEDARRLVKMGAWREDVYVAGNLKYDAAEPKPSRVAELIRKVSSGRPVVVAGSTVDGKPQFEEQMVAQAGMGPVWQRFPDTLLILAPRHPTPGRMEEITDLMNGLGQSVRISELVDKDDLSLVMHLREVRPRFIVLDTIGDLAAVYAIADVAFVGGSLMQRGGHNPLEPARFGVPVVMGPSYENFRDIVGRMQAADGIAIVKDEFDLHETILFLLSNPEKARAMGEHGRQVFEQQQGATTRTVEALLELINSAQTTHEEAR